MNYWLCKTEPTSYSIDDLKRDQRTEWNGVRNYQARNFIRDDMKVGDKVFIYHSNTEPIGIVGIAKVCQESHPDISALDKKDNHYDPKSKKDSPIWFNVDLCFVKKYKETITLKAIKKDDRLKGIRVAQKGVRLSVMPIDTEHGRHLEIMTK
ncbi:MAG: EVE domain-containing protein [bacterium]|nr:EVE domain-containing protein [bacterium]